MRYVIALLLLISTAAYAQVDINKLGELNKACEPHLKMIKNPNFKGAAFIPKWDEGWENCAAIEEAWALSEPGRIAAQHKAKELENKAAIDAIAKDLKK